MKRTLVLAGACLLLTGNCFAFVNSSMRSEKASLASTEISTTSAVLPQDKPQTRTHKVKLGNAKDRKVIINIFNSQVQIVGHNSDEVVIEGTGASTPPARAEGLKPLYNQAEDNTGMGLAAVKDNNTLTITKASRADGKYTIRVPKNVAVVYKEVNWTSGDLTIADVDGEIELKLNNGSATINNVSGPIVANTINGNLDIKFASLDQNRPNSISSISGKVDITLPTNTKANFKLKSLQGEIYTDFDMNLKKDEQNDLAKIGGGNTIDGRTNGGGVEMNIQTISSDIFIRKKK